MAEYTFPKGIAKLCNSETFSDLTIRCGDRKWRAHKAIVCSQSEVLFNACKGPFMEARTSEIPLEDDDPDCIQALLTYFYTGAYGDGECPESDSQVLFSLRVFAIAEKYFVQPLLGTARDTFKKSLSAKAFDPDLLKDVIQGWSTSTSDNDKILGPPILDHILEHKAEIYGSDQPSALKQIISEIPWLAGKINERLVRADMAVENIARVYHCGTCEDVAFLVTADMAPKRLQSASCPKCGTLQVFAFTANTHSRNKPVQISHVIVKPV